MDYNYWFKECVQLLEDYAKVFNMTYEEINIWIFCIIEPIVFIVMLLVIIIQYRKLRKIQNK
jgi:hypothetical protein